MAEGGAAHRNQVAGAYTFPVNLTLQYHDGFSTVLHSYSLEDYKQIETEIIIPHLQVFHKFWADQMKVDLLETYCEDNPASITFLVKVHHMANLNDFLEAKESSNGLNILHQHFMQLGILSVLNLPHDCQRFIALNVKVSEKWNNEMQEMIQTGCFVCNDAKKQADVLDKRSQQQCPKTEDHPVRNRPSQPNSSMTKDNHVLEMDTLMTSFKPEQRDILMQRFKSMTTGKQQSTLEVLKSLPPSQIENMIIILCPGGEEHIIQNQQQQNFDCTAAKKEEDTTLDSCKNVFSHKNLHAPSLQQQSETMQGVHTASAATDSTDNTREWHSNTTHANFSRKTEKREGKKQLNLQTVNMDFMLYLDSSIIGEKESVEHVYVVFDRVPGKDRIEMSRGNYRSNEIWYAKEVSIPHADRNCTYYYSFEVKKWRYVAYFTEKTTEILRRALNTRNNIKHYGIFCQPKISRFSREQRVLDLKGKLTFLAEQVYTLGKYPDTNKLKSCLDHFYELQLNETKYSSDFQEILIFINAFVATCNHKLHSLQAVFITMILGIFRHLLYQCNAKYLQPLGKNISLELLDTMSEYGQQLPQEYEKHMIFIANDLLKHVFKDTLSILHQMCYLYPMLSIKTLLEKKTSTTFVYADVDYKIRDKVLTLVSKNFQNSWKELLARLLDEIQLVTDCDPLARQLECKLERNYKDEALRMINERKYKLANSKMEKICEGPNCLEKLFAENRHLKGQKVQYKEYKALFEKKIVKFLEFQNHESIMSLTDDIRKVLNEKDTFQVITERTNILEKLCENRVHEFHNIAIQLLKTQKFTTEIRREDFQRCVKIWFDKAMEYGLNAARETTSKTLSSFSGMLIAYEKAAQLLACKPVADTDSIRKSIEKVAFKEMEHCSIEELLKSVDSLERKSNDLPVKLIEEHIIQLVNKKLENQTNSSYQWLYTLLEGNSTKAINQMKCNLAQAVLDGISKQSEHCYGDIRERLKEIFKRNQVWKKIFTQKGLVAETVQLHSTCVQVKKEIKELAENLNTASITMQQYYTLTDVIATFNEKECVELMECCLPAHRKWTVSNCLLKANSDVKDMNKCLHDLEDYNQFFLQPLTEIANIKDIPEFVASLKEKRQHLYKSSPLSLQKAKSPELWKDLYSLHGSVKYFLQLQSSTIFISLCKRKLEQHFEKPLNVSDTSIPLMKYDDTAKSDNDDEDMDGLRSLYDDSDDESIPPADEESTIQTADIPTITKLIEEKCVEEYRNTFESLLNGKNKDLAEIKDLFAKCDVKKELKHAEDYLNRKCNEKMTKSLQNVIQMKTIISRARDMEEVLKVFDQEIQLQEESKFSRAVQVLMRHQYDTCITLFAMSESVERVGSVSDTLDLYNWEIIKQLAKSKQLVTYLRQKVDQDFRNLIDAVEEHSEHCLKETDINDFIEIKKFITPLLKTIYQQEEQFFTILKTKCAEFKIVDVPKKIESCRYHLYSLQALIKGVGNREEMTHEIIRNSMVDGSLLFSLEKDKTSCDVSLSYKRKKGRIDKNLDEMNDLRSRALLLYVSETNDHKTEVSDDVKECDSSESKSTSKTQLKEFAEAVDHATMISSLLTELHQSGHFLYRSCKRKIPIKQKTELIKHRHQLLGELQNWQKLLSKARADWYYLNYIHSNMLYDIYECATKGMNNDNVMASFKYINPQTDLHMFSKTISVVETDSLDSKVLKVGSRLHDVYSAVPEYTPQPMSNISSLQGFEITSATSRRLQSAVLTGKLYIAALHPQSKQVFSTIMELYANTNQYFPQAQQLLLCNEETSWEEIQLLLNRCYNTPSRQKNLFCIANIELLSSDNQSRFIEQLHCIKEWQAEMYGSCDSLRQEDSFFGNILLAVVARVPDFHPLIDQFQDNVHRLQGMSDSAMKGCISELRPNMVVVTSDLPGQGKTEHIYTKASKHSVGVKTLAIGGPASKQHIIKQLRDLKLKKHHMLHIDLAEVTDFYNLDNILFELLILGTMSHEGKHFHLPTQHVCIEIANTMHDILLNTLASVKFFNRDHIKWQVFENMVISEELSSPVQIVCHYLQKLEDGTLDTTDIEISADSTLQPLPGNVCVHLLKRLFTGVQNLSFSIVETFLKSLSDQLNKFGKSYYFKTDSLEDTIGNSSNVRSSLVQAMVGVFKDFAQRSVVACRSGQKETISQSTSSQATRAEISAKRFEHMLQWSEENHLFFIFHGRDPHTLSALYRNLEAVPNDVKNLFLKQDSEKEELTDFSMATREELQDTLECIVQEKPRQMSNDEYKEMLTSYALTPDNLLKMVLIYLRIKSKVPVIIMGETGCGKTRLVTYMAKTCGIPLHIFSIHAGITEEQIISTLLDKNEKAISNPKEEIWMFLDEINTCDHLGVLNDIICHHQCMGKLLAPNLSFMAACNPYKLRGIHSVQTAGLEGKIKTDELSKLVYRVHPLPESMIDYVWDYGTLSETDERYYIDRMLADVFSTSEQNSLFVDLVSASQKYMREEYEGTKENPNLWCVSLRDVYRCKVLVRWMLDFLITKEKCVSLFKSLCNQNEQQCTAMILALAHCYHSRIGKENKRKGYRKRLSDIFRKHRRQLLNEGKIRNIIRKQQEDIVNVMELPEGTAKNSALLENVFVMLVCILNQIPIFVVGKPGCSKSLSMQLIRSNLRGQESPNEFFREFPQVYIVSYQGSESSTSEGIEKVFMKARNYQKLNKDNNVLAVVLLDEIGLAEVSKSNPLKVLHSLLEPSDDDVKVAVVGISNWALDGAKMNRAIHLSRPEFEEHELIDTAIAISRATVSSVHTHEGLQQKVNTAIAKAYHEYQTKQKYNMYPNFHGLRDFYSLVKCIASMDSVRDTGNLDDLETAIYRNFGGNPVNMSDIMTIFKNHLNKNDFDMKESTHRPSSELLTRENIKDKCARHLMLITNGDSALTILDHTLKYLNRDYEVIFGSQFEDDLSDDYNYRILSRIILCIERGIVLILKDLESVYGSLYDMLNQNYTIVDGKKNCRIALGPYSNPMCNVHDDFRCIVLIDQADVKYTDPPFLNRFEKQLLRFADVLSKDQEDIVQHLRQWVDSFSTIGGYQFSAKNAFLGYGEDTINSLVLQQGSDERENVIMQCKRDLLQLVSPEGILRASKSLLAQQDLSQVTSDQEMYFQEPVHNGFANLLQNILQNEHTAYNKITSDEIGIQLVVMTQSSVFANITEDILGIIECQSEKLSSFKSEKMLTDKLKSFFDSENKLLLVHCNPRKEAAQMPLAKSAIDIKRKEYKQSLKSETGLPKHICVIVHLNQSQDTFWHFNFSSGWNSIVIDPLETPTTALPQFLGKSVCEVLKDSSLYPAESCIRKELLKAFTFINYTGITRKVEDIHTLINNIGKSPEMLTCLKNKVLDWLQTNGFNKPCNHKFDSNMWQVHVACDRYLAASTCAHSLTSYVTAKVRLALAPLIFLLENYCAWGGFFSEDTGIPNEIHQQLWTELFRHKHVIDTSTIPSPTGPECYNLNTTQVETTCPFSIFFLKRLEALTPLFKDEKIDDDYDDSCTRMLLQKQQDEHFLHIFRVELENFTNHRHHLYFKTLFIQDLCNFKAATVAPHLDSKSRFRVFEWAFAGKFSMTSEPLETTVTKLYMLYWRSQDMIEALLQLLSSVTSTKALQISLDDILKSEMKASRTTTVVDNKEQIEGSDFSKQSFKYYRRDGGTETPVTYTEENDVKTNLPSLSINSQLNLQSQQEDVCNSINLSEIKLEAEVMVEEVHPKDTIFSNNSDNVNNENIQNFLDDTIPMLDTLESSVLIESDERHSNPYDDDTTTGTIQENPQNISPAELCKTNVSRSPVCDECESDLEFPATELPAHLLESSEDVVSSPASAELTSIQQQGMHLHEQYHNILSDNESEDESVASTKTDDMTKEEQLIETICWYLMPSEELLEKFGSTEQWQRKINILLDLSSKVSNYPTALHLIRVFTDMTEVILGSTKDTGQSVLHKMYEKVKSLKEDGQDPSDSVDLAEFLILQLDNMKQVSPMDKQEFLCLYFGRCLDANNNSITFNTFLNLVQDEELPDKHLHHCRSLIYRILTPETDEEKAFFYSLLIGNDVLGYDHDQLEALDECLSCLNDLNHPLAVLCSDIIETEVLNPIDKDTVIHNIQISDSELLHQLQEAAKLMKNTTKPSLQILTAAAILRKFLKVLSDVLSVYMKKQDFEHNSVSQLLMHYSFLFQFQSDDHRSRCISWNLFAYFLKKVKSMTSLSAILSICDAQKSFLLPIKAMDLEQDTDIFQEPIGFNPMAYATYYSEVLLAIENLVDDNESTECAILEKACESYEYSLSIIAVLFQKFCMVRCYRELKEYEIQTAALLDTYVQQYKEPYQRLVKTLLGVETAPMNAELAYPANMVTTYIGLVQIHLQSILVSHQNITHKLGLNIFSTCYCNPEQLTNIFVPTCGNNATENLTKGKKIIYQNCSCGHRVLLKGTNQQEYRCPVCDHFTPIIQSDKNKRLPQNDEKGLDLEVRHQHGIYEVLISSPQMSPIAFRILRILLKSCLLAGLQTQSTTANQIAKIMKCAVENISKELQKLVEDDWRILEKLLGGYEEASEFLHVCLQELLPRLLTTDSQVCDSIASRNEFEKCFGDDIDKLVTKRHSYAIESKKRSKVDEKKFPQGQEMLRQQILEIDYDPSSVDQHKHTLALFQDTKEPALENFAAEYMSSPSKAKFPFLQVFFQFHIGLQLTKNIKHLIDWHRLMLSHLDRKITREETKLQTVDTFVQSIENKQERQMSEKIFRAFQSALQHVKENGRQIIPLEIIQKLPNVHEDICIADCVISNASCPLYEILQYLVNIQNNFIDSCLQASLLHNTSPLGHMVHLDDTAIAKTVMVQESQDKHVVDFEWQNDLLRKHSQCETRYGMGKCLQYDFRTIEAELSNDLVVGKAWLEVERGKFTYFHFAKELFHSSSNILKEIKGVIPQESELPNEIVAAVQREKEHSPQNLPELLSQLEIVLCLVKRTSGTKDESLLHYARKWLSTSSSKFPEHLLPEPADSIKLCHILRLYELLEDTQATRAIESLKDDYRTPLDSSTFDNQEQQQSLLRLLKESFNKADMPTLQALGTCLKRFSYRYLSVDIDINQRPDRPLVSFVDSETLWPDNFLTNGKLPKFGGSLDPQEVEEILPTDVCLKHIYQTYKLLEETIKDKREKEEQSIVRKQKPSQTRQRRQKGFRKT